MIRRREFVAGAILVLVQADAARADAAAKAFLEKIYAAYKGKKSKGIPLDSDAMLRQYFEPSLAALMIKDEATARKHGDIGTLESDPFLNAQDWVIGPVEITVEDIALDKAKATAKFTNFKMPETVLYDLVKLKDGWRIADITWPENPVDARTLRGLYVKKK
jgi:Protein of unknown function (DUF3828)